MITVKLTRCFFLFCLGGLSLRVTYTPQYPDELPEYEIETIEGQIPQTYYTKIREAVKTAVSFSSGFSFFFISLLKSI
jgi:hypothetical protein